MLSPRAIAVQGLGSSARFVALQGLVPVAASPSFGFGGLSAAGRRNKRWPTPTKKQRSRDFEDLFMLAPTE